MPTTTTSAGPCPRLRRFRYEPTPLPEREGPPAGPGISPEGQRHRSDAAPAVPRDRAAAREFVAAHRAATRILRLALEVLDGKRPYRQLTDHFTGRPLRYWRAKAAARTVRASAQHGRTHLCLVRPGVAEVAMTCLIDRRHHALAARFEHRRGGWRCTAIRLG